MRAIVVTLIERPARTHGSLLKAPYNPYPRLLRPLRINSTTCPFKNHPAEMRNRNTTLQVTSRL
jgi:hypothetical protein